MKVAAMTDRTHNPFDEAYRVSCLRENLTSSSDGEGLETGRALTQVPRQSFTRQPSFRDTKDLRFGMGMRSTRISTPERRDRLFLLNAFAIVLLTLLGAAGESLGYDKHLRANTVKRRTHSLFRQGCMLYDLIPNMRKERLRPLMERFSQLLLEHRSFKDVLCVV